MARRRGLTPEERDLWTRIARRVTPITPAAGPEGGTLPPEADKIASRPRDRAPETASPTWPRFAIGQSVADTREAFSPALSPAERLAKAPRRMDHKLHRRMSQGKLRPEARLDLHGMTLSAAHPELIRFVLSCHARGHRLVLVITGKGRGDHGPLPTRPGALRHQVPHWLHGAPLGPVVQQVTPAHCRHGGEGAYYVYLRKAPGRDGSA